MDKEVRIQMYFSADEMKRIKEAATHLGEDPMDFIVDAVNEKVDAVEKSPFPPDHVMQPHSFDFREWSNRELKVIPEEQRIKEN